MTEEIQSTKERIFNNLDHPQHKTLIGRLVALGLVLLGFLYGFIAIFETEPELILNYSISFIIIESIIGIIFIIEFVLRLWTSTINPEYKDA